HQKIYTHASPSRRVVAGRFCGWASTLTLCATTECGGDGEGSSRTCVCVCVCVSARAREGEREFVHACLSEYISVCVRERERVRVCVCVCECVNKRADSWMGIGQQFGQQVFFF